MYKTVRVFRRQYSRKRLDIKSKQQRVLQQVANLKIMICFTWATKQSGNVSSPVMNSLNRFWFLVLVQLPRHEPL